MVEKPTQIPTEVNKQYQVWSRFACSATATDYETVEACLPNEYSTPLLVENARIIKRTYPNKNSATPLNATRIDKEEQKAFAQDLKQGTRDKYVDLVHVSTSLPNIQAETYYLDTTASEIFSMDRANENYPATIHMRSKESTYQQVNLKNSALLWDLDTASLFDCKFTDSQFEQSHIKDGLLFNVEYTNTDFDRNTWDEVLAQDCTFKDCHFKNVVFSGNGFTRCVFDHCTFENVTFENNRFSNNSAFKNGCDMSGIKGFDTTRLLEPFTIDESCTTNAEIDLTMQRHHNLLAGTPDSGSVSTEGASVTRIHPNIKMPEGFGLGAGADGLDAPNVVRFPSRQTPPTDDGA